MQKNRIIKLKNGEKKAVHEKKWHRALENVKEILNESCPILDLDNKNVCISVEINKSQSITSIYFCWKDFDNEILKVSDICHEKENILQIGSQYSLLTF